jgi:hypothetical protein
MNGSGVSPALVVVVEVRGRHAVGMVGMILEILPRQRDWSTHSPFPAHRARMHPSPAAHLGAARLPRSGLRAATPRYAIGSDES